MGDLFLEPNGLVETSSEDTRLTVRFVSPQTRNPISSKVLGYLEDLVDLCEADTYLQEIVFTGTDGVFASGANLHEIAALVPAEARDFAVRGQILMGRIASLPIMTVALVNGYCYGGALDLALACDRRIASKNATFCHTGAGLGIITGWGGTQRLPRLIGQANALELFFTAVPISAKRALEVGLVDELVS